LWEIKAKARHKGGLFFFRQYSFIKYVSVR